MIEIKNQKFKILPLHEIDAIKLPDKIDIKQLIIKDRLQLKTMYEEILKDEIQDTNKEYYFSD